MTDDNAEMEDSKSRLPSDDAPHISKAISLDDVYRKFGEAAEAAQIIETELGNMLFAFDVSKENLLEASDPQRARKLIDTVNRQTFGATFKKFAAKKDVPKDVEDLIWNAIEERNRLSHHFYRQHNFRKNSDSGRAIMLKDLESIHDTLLGAMKAISRLNGIDLEAWSTTVDTMKTNALISVLDIHLPI